MNRTGTGTRMHETEAGLALEGPLTVVAEVDGAFILIGDEFLDEIIRRRYAPRMGDLWRDQPALKVDKVRITIERVLEGYEDDPPFPGDR